MGSVATGGLKIFATGVAVAATALAALGTAAVDSYTEFEQLKGGIETLFGARGASSVEEYAEIVGKSVEEIQAEYDMLMEAQTLAMDNASDAYKNAGMSANEYMDTVTGFAAALKQSTEDEVEAAEVANQAVVDMADNASKMGTSMESIQNAYQGFAKGNYTMLDNLKLGYGGTKTEMERLLEDATAISGVEYDINNLADVYAAIHVIQEELGIAGATALEASTTISGSCNAMKAAWTNLVTGLADENADLEKLIEDFVDSATVYAQNLLPVVEQVLTGIGTLVEELLPVIVERIPEIVNTVLPGLLESGVNMLLTIAEGIVSAMPSLAETAYSLISQLVTAITGNAGQVLNSGSETLLSFVTGIANAIPDLLLMAVDTIVSLAMALTDPDTLTNIINSGIAIILGLVDGILHAIPELLAAIPKIIGQLVAAIIANIPQLAVAALEIMIQLAGFLLDSLVHVIDAIPQMFNSICESFVEMDWKSIGDNIIDGIWSGLEAGWDWLTEYVSDLANSLFGAACEELDINSPSRKFKWIGEMCVEGAEEPFEEFNPYEMLHNSMEANISGLKATYARATAGMSGGGGMSWNQTVNINQPISTPDEMARAIRTESKYGLITGEGEVVFG